MASSSKNKEGTDYIGTDNEMCQHYINAFQIIGKKWNGLIISSLCAGNYMRFKDLTRCVRACSDRVLVERLKELEKEGIVKRSVDSNTKIISYGLTRKGADLKPALDKIHDWADKWV